MAAVRRLTGDEHLSHEFASTWSTYDLDPPTRTLLSYAAKLTEAPNMIDEEDIGRLAEAGWSEKAIWEITALISFFNFSGRLEAASGLPHDRIPAAARMAEARETGMTHRLPNQVPSSSTLKP